MKRGVYTPKQIKEMYPSKEKIKKYFDVNTEESREFWNTVNSEVLKHFAERVFYNPNIYKLKKSELIELMCNRSMRANFINPNHSKNKKYCDNLFEDTGNIKETIEKTRVVRTKKKFSTNPVDENNLTKQEKSNYMIQKKQPSFVSNNMPVRKCTIENCDKRESCKYWINKKVQNGDLCIEDIDRIDKWINAFKNKNPEDLTENAGLMCGMFELQLIQMANRIQQDGVMIEVVKVDRMGKPVFDNDGKPITEFVAHPLMKEMTKIVSVLKINLPEYSMTPKSKGETSEMGGHIKEENKMDLKEVFKEQKASHALLMQAIENSKKTKARLFKSEDDEDDNDGFLTKEQLKRLPKSIKDSLITVN